MKLGPFPWLKRLGITPICWDLPPFSSLQLHTRFYKLILWVQQHSRVLHKHFKKAKTKQNQSKQKKQTRKQKEKHNYINPGFDVLVLYSICLFVHFFSGGSSCRILFFGDSGFDCDFVCCSCLFVLLLCLCAKINLSVEAGVLKLVARWSAHLDIGWSWIAREYGLCMLPRWPKIWNTTKGTSSNMGTHTHNFD